MCTSYYVAVVAGLLEVSDASIDASTADSTADQHRRLHRAGYASTADTDASIDASTADTDASTATT